METSLIIVNWNGRDLLGDCLPSLEKQTEPAEEVIVVDNGSSDDSVEFLRASFPYVKVVSLDKNYGFAKANNTGIRSAGGGRIALLNNDTVVDSRWLEELNNALDNHPEVGFCASKMLMYRDPSIIDAAGDMLGIARAYKRGHGRPDGKEFNEPAYVFGACAGAAIYRSEMLDNIGLFDETFVSNLEDVDLSFRAQLAGYKCMYVPTAVVYHKVGETKRRTGWTHKLTYRNNKLMWLKNAPGWLLIKYAGQVLLEEVRKLADSLGVDRSGLRPPNSQRLKTLLAADAEVFWLLPKIGRKRRKIQRRRIVNTQYIESFLAR
jgi:GT2 family glycosyltransferase